MRYHQGERVIIQCPRCKELTEIKQEHNLFGEIVKVLRCLKCGCVYNRHDGIHWEIIIETTRETQHEK